MNPKVSIIVPVYNAEKYLRRCLDSLVEQDLSDIEIIVVNDGSSDSSIKILEEYRHEDNRIKIIHKTNEGVSSARNIGIELAKGEFIGFVDSDDWVDKEMYKVLYDTVTKENAEIIMCTYIREFGSHSKKKNFNLPSKIIYNDEEVKTRVMRRLIGPVNEEIANPELLDAWGTVWSKLYRTDLIKQNNLTFSDLREIGTNEDSLFNILAVFHAQSFIFINTPYYHYWRENNGSVTSGFNPYLIDQWFNLYSKIGSFIEENKLDVNFQIALNNRICLNILGLGFNTISKGNNASFLMKIKKISTILNDQRIVRSFKQLKLSHFSIAWRAFYFCAKVRFSFGVYFMLIAINFLRRTVR
jgi:glycosyltransferase involved in cell wall biosynthesis